MRVLQSQASQSQVGFCPTPIFVGTHKDMEHQCSESREEKNQKIREMLLPAVQKDAIYCGEGLKELIFAVNAKNPGPLEQKLAAEIRKVIVEGSHVKPKQIPLRWHALELALQKLMLELGRGSLFINQNCRSTDTSYTLTVGRVLTTKVSQINLGQLLSRAALKIRLDSCLSTTQSA